MFFVCLFVCFWLPFSLLLFQIFSFVGEEDLKKLQESGLDPDIVALEVLETVCSSLFLLSFPFLSFPLYLTLSTQHGDVSVRYSAFTVGPMISNREFVFIQVTRDMPGSPFPSFFFLSPFSFLLSPFSFLLSPFSFLLYSFPFSFDS